MHKYIGIINIVEYLLQFLLSQSHLCSPNTHGPLLGHEVGPYKTGAPDSCIYHNKQAHHPPF